MPSFKRPIGRRGHPFKPWPGGKLSLSVNPRRGNLPELAGADHPDGLPSPISYNASGGEVFQQIGGMGYTGGGFGHPGCDLAGLGDVLRARMVGLRRSATSDSRVSARKRRTVPTFSRLTAAPQFR